MNDSRWQAADYQQVYVWVSKSMKKQAQNPVDINLLNTNST